VDDVNDARRVENVGDLQPPSCSSLAANDVPVALTARAAAVVDEVFGLRRHHAMPSYVVYVPRIPTEQVVHEYII
jgi:hypothetical protein